MPSFKRVPRLKAPSPHLQAWADAICDAIDAARNLSFSGPVAASRRPYGTHLSVQRPSLFARGIVTVAFTARTGTPGPGTGTVTLYDRSIDGTTYTAGLTGVTVENWSLATPGVGKWVKMHINEGGVLELVSAEC